MKIAFDFLAAELTRQPLVFAMPIPSPPLLHALRPPLSLSDPGRIKGFFFVSSSSRL